jgi:hypothetical protein
MGVFFSFLCYFFYFVQVFSSHRLLRVVGCDRVWVVSNVRSEFAFVSIFSVSASSSGIMYE